MIPAGRKRTWFLLVQAHQPRADSLRVLVFMVNVTNPEKSCLKEYFGMRERKLLSGKSLPPRRKMMWTLVPENFFACQDTSASPFLLGVPVPKCGSGQRQDFIRKLGHSQFLPSSSVLERNGDNVTYLQLCIKPKYKNKIQNQSQTPLPYWKLSLVLACRCHVAQETTLRVPACLDCVHYESLVSSSQISCPLWPRGIF